MIHNIDLIIEILRKRTKQSPEPMTREIVSLYGKNSYLILISCLLSLQNRDVVTLPVSKLLFEHVSTPEQMLALSQAKLEEFIKSVNFYKTKAMRIRLISQELLKKFNGNVPQTAAELLSIKGIGLKTAHLVLAEAFEIPVICVDTHVHRLSNHWGLVRTKTPEQTEKALCMILPKKYWIEWNYLLVKWGQNICKLHILPCMNCSDIIKIVQKEKS